MTDFESDFLKNRATPLSENLIQGFVDSVIENAHQYNWTRHGIGFMKTNISSNVRVHVWNQRLRKPGVTTMHTHPWSFESYIVRGRLTNKVFKDEGDSLIHVTIPMVKACIDCTSGKLYGTAEHTSVRLTRNRTYEKGQFYGQKWYDTHRSIAEDGTVSVIMKYPDERPKGLPVYTYWHEDGEWVDADQREVTDYEYRMAIAGAKDLA